MTNYDMFKVMAEDFTKKVNDTFGVNLGTSAFPTLTNERKEFWLQEFTGQPIESAEWIWDENGYDWNLGCWVCGNCHGINANIPADKNTNPYLIAGAKYCPTCGHKMIKKDKEIKDNGE